MSKNALQPLAGYEMLGVANIRRKKTAQKSITIIHQSLVSVSNVRH